MVRGLDAAGVVCHRFLREGRVISPPPKIPNYRSVLIVTNAEKTPWGQTTSSPPVNEREKEWQLSTNYTSHQKTNAATKTS
jgi:hypothetical protein